MLSLLALGTISAAAEFVPIGQSAAVTVTWYACQKKDDIQFLKGLSQKHWADATQFAEINNCKLLHPGGTWKVDDSSSWTHNTCLRLNENASCYWFPERFIKKHASN